MNARRAISFVAASTLVTLPAFGQVDSPKDHPDWDSPSVGEGVVDYKEGLAIPRAATSVERALEASGEVFAPVLRGAGLPEGPLWCPPEYAPMEGIIISWEGPSSWRTILANMAREITTTGNAKIFCIVDNPSEATAAEFDMVNAGADPSKIETLVRTTDSIWMRDYGPRFVYEGGVRVIADHTYNILSRVNDNALTDFFAVEKGFTQYQVPLRHGGGNYHLDALGKGYATRLIVNENAQSEAQIIQLWQDYWGLDTQMFTPLPTSVDGTQHIDMWMQVIADDKVMISDWPTQSGSIQDQICDDAAADFASRGFTVYRPPAIRTGSGFSGAHYTYTNVVMCNDVVLVPSYTNGAVVGFNAPALATWQSALPGKTIVQINCQAIVTAAGVMHCIVMHVPVGMNGDGPSVYVQSPNGGESFNPGETVQIRWISDDDERPFLGAVDLSTDGGQSYDQVAVIGNTGSYNWTVPDVAATDARIRIRAEDRDGNEGSDESDAGFVINGTSPACAADWNEDGGVNDQDFFDWANDFFSQTGPQGSSDFNNDGNENDQDWFDFVNEFFNPAPGC